MQDLEILKFIRENADWREKLAKPPYCISINEDKNFALLKYSQIESDFNEKICRECRGIIIDKNEISVAGLSFYKFFNVQEEFADSIDWATAEVQEKIDGSKILVWYDKYKKKWRISTSGMLDAYYAGANAFITFGELFEKAIAEQGYIKEMDFFYNSLNEKTCYTFELISPLSRLTVPYPRTDLYLTSVRNLETLEEFNPCQTPLVFKYHMKVPGYYKLKTLEDCLEAVNQFDMNHEGFVVVDANWKRVKIKSPAYILASRAIQPIIGGPNVKNLSPKPILRIIEENETSEFLGICPEGKPYFDKVQKAKDEFLTKFIHAVKYTIAIKRESKDRKEAARRIYELCDNVKLPISGFLFRYLSSDLPAEEFVRKQWNQLTINQKLEYLQLK